MKNFSVILSILLFSILSGANESRCRAVVTEGIDYSGSGGGVGVSSPLSEFTNAVKNELETKGYTLVDSAPTDSEYYLFDARSSVHVLTNPSNGEVKRFCKGSIEMTNTAHAKEFNEYVAKNPRATHFGYNGRKSVGFTSDWSWVFRCSSVTQAVIERIPPCGQIMNTK